MVAARPGHGCIRQFRGMRSALVMGTDSLYIAQFPTCLTTTAPGGGMIGVAYGTRDKCIMKWE
jgi:hypothetical protein